MNYFEDVPTGHQIALGTYTFSQDEIIAFAQKYDPQSFHLDPVAAQDSLLGGLCASGWHTVAIWMKLMVAYMKTETLKARQEGRSMAALGPSPGFRDLKWIKPVFAGDDITYRSVLIDKHESRSRPEWGLLDHKNTGVNQAGDEVLTFIGSVFVQRRPKMPQEMNADDQ